MVDTTNIGPLAAQLQATLDKIPAYTWYAAPTGGLTFVNKRCVELLRCPRYIWEWIARERSQGTQGHRP